MTCKDCIHYEVCEWDKDKYDKSIITSFPNCDEKNCGLFQNKADFVEVVRCGKCKHGEVSIMSKSKDGEEKIACYCNLKNRVTDVDYYCPSGERRDT